MADDTTWYRRDGDDWVLILYLQPGARQTGPAGLFDGALKVRLAAPPVEGKANIALTKWLAGRFDVPKQRVTIEQGELSRHKRVRIRGSAIAPTVALGEAAS